MINPIDDFESVSNERFKILQHLGTGGFASTYKARVLDEDLIEDYRTNVVVLKIPSSKKGEKNLKHNDGVVGLAMQLANVRSPNLVRFLDLSAFQNKVVMVMEFVPGGSLEKLVGGGGGHQLAIDRALQIGEGTLNGIVTIHANHILHRDIKPANILMDGDEPKLADFGISRIIDPHQKASTSTGTIPYMSPEQLYGQACFASDQCSFAVMFYQMLTGRLPWREVEQAPLIDEIRNCQPRAPMDIRSEIPRSISDFIMRALIKEPTGRYADAEAMLEALRQAKRQTSTGKTEANLDRARQLVAEDRGGADIEKELAALLAKHPADARFYQLIGEHHNPRQS